MRRFWPDDLKSIFDHAEEVQLTIPKSERDGTDEPAATHRAALRLRLTEADYQRIWPLAETRYRLDGRYAGKAVTLIVNNPHYHAWHPADGGTEDHVSESGVSRSVKYIVAHMLMDDVREEAVA